MFNEEEKIKKYFKYRLSKREIGFDVSEKLDAEEILFLIEVGLPNKVLDFDFSLPIVWKNTNELIIGHLDKRPLLLNTKSSAIYLGNFDIYIAKNLKSFFYQLYTYDYLWNVMIAENQFGKYRENENYKRYAKCFEDQLLKIDIDLLQNDVSYFWGSLIEDIEFGIVG